MNQGRPRALLLLLLVAGAFLLSACSPFDRQQAITCVAIATAIGPDDRPISVENVAPLDGVPHALRVIFTAAGDPRQLFADCVFAGGPLDAGRTEVLAVRGSDGILSDVQVELLRRWFLEQPGAIAAAVAETDWQPPSIALLDVEPPKDVGYALQQVVNTANVAALYMPLALAYALIYGLIGRINMAFGEIATIGGFGAVFGVQTAVAAHLPGAGTAILLGLLVALSLAALCGWLIGRSVVLPLAEAPGQPFIVATVGLALFLSEGMRLAQGSREIWLEPMLETPLVLTAGPFPVVLTEMRLLILALAVAGLLAVLALMRRSRFGKAWRAVADDRLMARLSGVDPIAVTAATLILASALAAFGGSVLALSYGSTSYAGGLVIGLKALLASLVGGAGSLPGAVLGGLLIACIETGWSAYFDAAERDIVVLAVVTILFLLRPDGLLGNGRALEEGRIIRLS